MNEPHQQPSNDRSPTSPTCPTGEWFNISATNLDGPSVPAQEWPALSGYVVEKELGRGSMGVVFLVRQTGLDRLVALKMVLGGGWAGDVQIERFRREAHLLAQLNHPGIVQIHEVGEWQGLPYFVMEYVAGGALDKWAEWHRFSPPQAARFVAVVARTIQTAHEAGIIHRDLKPANILLTPDGEPKIADFGLAKHVASADGTSASPQLTATSMTVGTPAPS